MNGNVDIVVREWHELCQWDPLLPPDSRPPLARVLVDAVEEAMQRPQPIGWGLDPALQLAVELFASSAGTIDVAVGHLVCLREAYRRAAKGHDNDSGELRDRRDMILDRAIWAVAGAGAARMQRQLAVDAVTGLPDRSTFERDVDRELRRALRYERPLSVACSGIDALEGVDAPDVVEAQVRRVASLLVTNVRAQDAAYRIGTGRFGLLLPETGVAAAEALLDRLRRAPIPGLSIGVATFPADGDEIVTLLHEAERRRGRTLAS